jgi:hypothetical protein
MMRIRPDPDPQHRGALYVVILKRGYPGKVILKNDQSFDQVTKKTLKSSNGTIGTSSYLKAEGINSCSCFQAKKLSLVYGMYPL